MLDDLQDCLGVDFAPETRRPLWHLGKWVSGLETMVKNIAALAKAGSLDNDLRTYAGEDVCGAHVVTWYEKKCRALFVQVKMGISGWSHDKRIWEGGANPQPARSSPRRGLLQIFTGLQVCPAKGKIISVPTTTTMNTNTNMATNERGYHVPIEVRQEAGARVRAFLLDDSVEGKVVRDRGVSFEARNEELLVKLQVRHKDAPRDPREEEGPSPPVEERKRHGAEATTTKVPTMKPSAATKRPAPAPSSLPSTVTPEAAPASKKGKLIQPATR